VLGFRGQGQSTRGFDGAGREAGQVARKLAEQLGSRVVGVRFPSSAGGSTYDADVAAGVRLAGRLMASACGQVVLVGYSQGAEVAHRVAVAHPRRVAGVVLMGDPLRDPADPVATLTLGTGPLSGRGNGGPYARFPSVVRARVLEVCVRGDDVCNAPLAGRVGPPSATHRTAYQGDGAVRRIVGAAS
jgi:pimeloyl-ACP methyl ester carboxylesterase